jgi:uncharacterized protein YndB with AHSA1/START domain
MGTLPRNGTVEVTTDASPEQIWDLLADVTRAGEWSHETRGGMWLDGATSARAGARFKGLNGKGRQRWSRVCEIETADRPHTLAWRTVPSRLFSDSTRWTFAITPVDGRARITQTFEVLKLHPVVDRIFYALIPAHRNRTAALRGDLEHLAAVAADAGALMGGPTQNT